MALTSILSLGRGRNSAVMAFLVSFALGASMVVVCSLIKNQASPPKAPNPKLQAPEKLQYPSSKERASVSKIASSDFEIWCLGFVWDLVLGILASLADALRHDFGS